MRNWGERIEFRVPGTPRPQGSVRAFKAGDKAIVTQGGSKKSRDELANYRNDIRNEAQKQMQDRPPFGGAVYLEVTFLFERPSAHFGTGKNAEFVKPSAPVHKLTAPDLDKLVRSVKDALKGVAYKDDAQVVRISAGKAFWATAGTTVRLWELH